MLDVHADQFDPELTPEEIAACIGDLYAESLACLTAALDEARDAALAPDPIISFKQWLLDRAELPGIESDIKGKFEPFGYQLAWAEFLEVPGKELYVSMTSARVGKTQLMTFKGLKSIENDRASTLLLQPTEDDAKDYVKSTVDPTIACTPCVANIMGNADAGENEWGTKYTSKGSVLRIRGAFSADTFRRLTVKEGHGDELDAAGWDNGSKSQGDKVDLLRERGRTLPGSRVYLWSTPTTIEHSRIYSWYLLGDRYAYFVPCPHCGEFQTLEFGGRESDHGVKWPKDDPEAAYYVCRHNGCVIEPSSKVWMDKNGELRLVQPGTDPRVASFHINALYSRFEKAGWGHLAREFVEANRQPTKQLRAEKLKSFFNLVMGEPWEEEEQRQVTPHDLCARLEIYTAEIPEGVLFLTAGVDTQTADGGRFEVSVYGWGANGERWLIGHWILKDNGLTDPRAWTSLEALLRRPFRTTTGHQMFVQGACIDSGGTYTQEVYAFTGRQPPRLRWWAIKGRNNAKGERSSDGVWPKTPTKTGLGSLLHLVDVDTAKDTLVRQLAAEVGEAGCFHWPSASLAGSTPIDDLFFTRLTREKQRAAPGRPGRTYWTSPTDQEPWDCLVYAYAAMMGLCSIPGNPYSRQVAIQQVAAAPAGSAEVVPAAPVVQQAQPAAPIAPPVPAPASRPVSKPKQQIITSPFMRRR